MPNLELIRDLPSVEYLRECFDYDRETGELRWKRRPREHFARPVDWVRCNAMCGQEAGYLDNGYRRVSLNSVDHKVHRIVWKWMTGEDPPVMLDHKDGIRANNRWSNLRDGSTYSGQKQNSGHYKSNTSGRRGVYPTKNGKWWVVVTCNGVRHNLGRFNTIEEASEAYESAASKLFGVFYRQPQYR